MKIYIRFLLLFIPHICCSQENKYSYDKIVKKISANTWWYYKFCTNDSCYLIDDSTFFSTSSNSYGFSLSQRNSRFKTNKNICCLEPSVWSYLKSPVSDSFSWFVIYDKIPNFCFIDSDVINNTYQLFTWGEDGLNRAQMNFISDSDFCIRRIDTTQNKVTVEKFYYKLRSSKQ
jgi:hypothetical protein